jgi:hypothetical protein
MEVSLTKKWLQAETNSKVFATKNHGDYQTDMQLMTCLFSPSIEKVAMVMLLDRKRDVCRVCIPPGKTGILKGFYIVCVCACECMFV